MAIRLIDRSMSRNFVYRTMWTPSKAMRTSHQITLSRTMM